jgi:RecA/RadA recombinase
VAKKKASRKKKSSKGRRASSGGRQQDTDARRRPEFNLGGSPERGRTRLHQLADQLGRNFGRSTALPLNVAPVARIMRMPFGILMLDWYTRGGLGLHRINRLVGPKSTLKSTLCLRALRSAQTHCRHCKFPIVVSPVTGERDCRCPSPRFWLHNEDDYSWLPSSVAIRLSYGMLPEDAVVKNVKGIGRVPVLKCEPPPHAFYSEATGKLLKKKPKVREIPFIETFRNEPMRCLYLDSEHTIDEAWAAANGVDTSLVLLVGGKWAEQSLQTIEEAVLTREFDFIVIDSTSVLEPKKELEKTYSDTAKVAARATVMSRFVRRHLAAAFEEGLTARYVPTVLMTSQVTTKGINSRHGRTWLDTTDGNAVNHAVSLDIHMNEEGYEFNAAKEYAIWGDFGFRVKKNKLGGSPGVSGTIRFWVKAEENHPIGDSDDLDTVMRYARNPNIGLIVEGTGAAKLTVMSPYLPDEGMAFRTVGACEEFLRENHTVYADLRERVLTALMTRDESLVVSAPAADAATEGM